VGGVLGRPGARPFVVDPSRGLSRAEVQERLASGLVNALPPPAGRGVAQILRANVPTRFNAILGSLLVVVAVVGPLQDGLFGVVLVVNTAIGIAQELRAKHALDRLAILSAPRAHVVRQGEVGDVALADVVLDDVVELRPGDQVSVDGEVLTADFLELDESLLSGEAEPLSKSAGDSVLSGTFVVSGSGRVRARRVGPTCYAAQVEAQARRFSLIRSELQQGTNAILRLVTWVMVPAGVALVLTQLLRSHQTSTDALRGSVAGVAAMVPEGLVLLSSVAFAVGALRLARRRVLVQELPAVEALARVDVLCIDKTGTLTAPGMRLSAVTPLSTESEARVVDVLEALVAADPAPNATLQALHRPGRLAPDWQVQTRVPFSSVRKWSAVTFIGQGTWVLGAPDVLLGPGQAATVVGPASRTLLLARSPVVLESPSLTSGLRPVALVTLAEDLRPDAAATIGYLLEQDVTVKVLSGDAPGTVGSVAARVGIPGSTRPRDASRLSDVELGQALGDFGVFGRVRPEQKLVAVRALQAVGHVVAMVGDGVNDVPALKQADIGIAMGAGSQSSRAVARLVLLDNSFSSVPAILDEGRRVIANIERVANLFVTKTVYAAVLAIVVAVSAVPFPFFPRHLTIVSTFTIGIPGFFLALAGDAPRATTGFTKRVLRFTLPAGLCAAAATFASYAIARAWAPIPAAGPRTAAMLALFSFGVWILVVVARPLSAPKVVLITSMAAAVVLPFASGFTRRTFGLALPAVPDLLATAGVVVGAAVLQSVWRAVVAARAATAPVSAGTGPT
jgi:cation-transporting ATPase E